jgi:hypothetical protein
MRIKRSLVLAIALLGACKPPTPAEQMDSIQSWLATAGMAGDAWLRHTTPDKYSRQTLKLSSETVHQISNDLLASLPPAMDSAAVDSVLSRSRGRLDQLARLIDAKNSPDFRQQLDSLRSDEKIVKALSDSMPKQ